MKIRHTPGLWAAILSLALTTGHAFGADISVVIAPAAPPMERLAARDLAETLGRLHPQDAFSVTTNFPGRGDCILLGTTSGDPRVNQWVAAGNLSGPESFVVTTVKEADRQLAVIAGADARGTVYGVYALLRKLGCGFLLTGDTVPPPTSKPFSFAGWELADHPLVRNRLVFNWHNFLSGCSTWNLEDWERWTTQSLKIGYNAIMVHAYGNNPMASFEFNGRAKPVGYLSTTTKGRDWSTMHVNDVRRLYGGEVFDQPVFGAEAAIVPDVERVAAARQLMQGVFAHARRRGMAVYFAVDVDTASANPQELIATLPETARFPIRMEKLNWMGQEDRRLWMADPDTPEGYQYYRAQVATLLRDYPTLDCLVVWFRRDRTPWMGLAAEEMPPAWQQEYQAELAKTPEAGKLWYAHNLFALSKVVKAFQRALRESGSRTWRGSMAGQRFPPVPQQRVLPPTRRWMAIRKRVGRQTARGNGCNSGSRLARLPGRSNSTGIAATSASPSSNCRPPRMDSSGRRSRICKAVQALHQPRREWTSSNWPHDSITASNTAR